VGGVGSPKITLPAFFWSVSARSWKDSAVPKSQEQIIRDLRDELDEAREIIRQLNDQLRNGKMPTLDYMHAFDLSKTEARIFSLLMDRESVSRSQFVEILWPQKYVGNSLVSCLVHHIRRKMNSLDVAIDLIHGHGYLITPPMKRRIRKLIEEWDAAGQPARRFKLQHRKPASVEIHG
jgi:DNA-binding winged helix-turn-helix (wHTH) protein